MSDNTKNVSLNNAYMSAGHAEAYPGILGYFRSQFIDALVNAFEIQVDSSANDYTISITYGGENTLYWTVKDEDGNILYEQEDTAVFDLSGTAGTKSIICTCEDLINVTSITLVSSSLVYANLANLIGLTALDISDNAGLITLIVPQTDSILDITINACGLHELDVSYLCFLEELQCRANVLAKLNTICCSMLGRIDCSDNLLESLDLDQLDSLVALVCNDNMIGAIDLTICPLLEELNISNNPITELDVSECVELSSLNVSGCNLTGIAIDAILIALDSNSIENGTLYYIGQVTEEDRTEASDVAYDSLVGKGWSINQEVQPVFEMTTDSESVSWTATVIKSGDTPTWSVYDTDDNLLTSQVSLSPSFDLSSYIGIKTIRVTSTDGWDGLTSFDGTSGALLTLTITALTSLNQFYTSGNSSLTTIIFTSTNNIYEIYVDGCSLTSDVIDEMIAALVGGGESNGTLYYPGQTGDVAPTIAACPDYTILVDNGWQITGESPCPPLFELTTDSESITWEPLLTKTGDPVSWEVWFEDALVDTVGPSNTPTINLSSYVGTKTIKVITTDGWDGISAANLAMLDLLTVTLEALAPSLESLIIFDNAALEELILINFTVLETLGAYSCALSSVDIEGCGSLTAINLNTNQLYALEIETTTYLADLNISFNPSFFALNVSGSLPACTYLNIDQCALGESGVEELFSILDDNGLSNGTFSYNDMAGGAPTSASCVAYTSLTGKGWTIEGVSPCPTTIVWANEPGGALGDNPDWDNHIGGLFVLDDALQGNSAGSAMYSHNPSAPRADYTVSATLAALVSGVFIGVAARINQGADSGYCLAKRDTGTYFFIIVSGVAQMGIALSFASSGSPGDVLSLEVVGDRLIGRINSTIILDVTHTGTQLVYTVPAIAPVDTTGATKMDFGRPGVSGYGIGASSILDWTYTPA